MAIQVVGKYLFWAEEPRNRWLVVVGGVKSVVASMLVVVCQLVNFDSYS